MANSMSTELVRDKLGQVVHEFAYQYRQHSNGGAVVQGFPFVIMGCSDELTFYRCFCSSYKPLADDAQNGCPISTVFADLQPEPVTQQGKRQPLDHGRAAAAQQCGIQSTLLVPVYDFDAQSPSCVFELAQQQPDVDFTLAVQILQDVAELEATQPTEVFEWSLRQPQQADSMISAAGSCNSILVEDLAETEFAGQSSAHDSDTTAHAMQLAAPAGGLAPVIRRCSRLIVEDQELASLSSMAIDDGEWDFDGRTSMASLTDTDREAWAQQWRQQQQHRLSRRVRRKSRRPSYIVTDHVICYDLPKQLLQQADAAGQSWQPPELPGNTTGTPSSVLPAAVFESAHPWPLTIPLESMLEEGCSNVEKVLDEASRPTGDAAGHAMISGAELSSRNAEWLPQKPAYRAMSLDSRRRSADCRRASAFSGSMSMMVLPASLDGQQLSFVGGSISAQQAKSVQLGPLIGAGSLGRLHRGSLGGKHFAIRVIQHSQQSIPKVSQVVEELSRICHPNLVKLHEHVTWGPGQPPDTPALGVNAVAAVPNKPLILLKDDSSSGKLPAQTAGGSLQGEDWAVAAETWLLQDMCDKGSLQQLLLNKTAGPLFAQGEPQLRLMLDILLGCACCMESLHCQGVVHGNLRARNVLLAGPQTRSKSEQQLVAHAVNHAAQDGSGALQLVPLLTDWGMSSLLSTSLPHTTHSAPEVMLGQQATKASDVFAFGVLMWEVFMGQEPWAGLTPEQVMSKVLLEAARLQFAPTIPQSSLMAARPSLQWFGDCRTFKKASLIRRLQDCLQSQPESINAA
eukprot:gene4103-4349_t